MSLFAVDVFLLSLPLVEPFVAAHGAMHHRDLTVVRVQAGEHIGWGECSALSSPTYTAEFAAGAYDVCSQRLAPMFITAVSQWDEAIPPAPIVADLVQRAFGPESCAENPMAVAAFEMAMLDLTLRRDQQSLAAFLHSRIRGQHPTSSNGAPRPHTPTGTVAAGAAVGLGATSEVLARVSSLLDEGYRRVKVKITPTTEAALFAGLRPLSEDHNIQLDANASFGHNESDRDRHLNQLATLANDGFSAVEQPFPPGQTSLAAQLVARSPVPVVADEAADSLASVGSLHQTKAASGVSVKSSRLGGLAAAEALHNFGLAKGLVLTPGGMVECGLGRHALAALGSLPGFQLAGDVGPARRWLRDDPWPDLTFRPSDGVVLVPTTPGVAPLPDLETLKRQTVHHHSVTGDTRPIG